MTFPTRLAAGTAALVSFTVLSACTIGDVDAADDSPTVVTITRSASDGSATAPSPTMEPAQETARESEQPVTTSTGNLAALAGRIIYLDPGHAGTAPPAELTAEDGRGGTKACNTSGTASDSGWPEHTFNWEIGQQLKAVLEGAGATVLLSRADDVGRADCIDERTHKENASAADVVVSLHADGSGPGNTGFHISAISDPLPQNLPEESSRLAAIVRDTMVSAGLPSSNYLGSEGLNPRADLTGLNLSTKPKILIEFGNMRDATDLAALNSTEGRQQRAQAVAEGIAAYLG